LFYIISPTGISEAWDEGDEYMLETRALYNDFLSYGSRGRLNKRFFSHLLLTDERWDILPQRRVEAVPTPMRL